MFPFLFSEPKVFPIFFSFFKVSCLVSTMFSSSDETSDADTSSQVDLFANTQIPTRNSHVADSNPDLWADTNFECPWFLLFQWNGDSNPFLLKALVDLDPLDIDDKWLSGTLSPKSRCKHRSFLKFPDFSISIFGKVHKRKQ